MALDGLMLSFLVDELKEKLIGCKVEKIFMPTKEEIVISFRSYKESYKLFMSSKVSSARINLTNINIENPKEPPMFCMLLRKHLQSAKLIDIKQENFERVIYLNFETYNEFGDLDSITLSCEILGRTSNIILINKENNIIDATKRIGLDKSSIRPILPGEKYIAPPKQDKLLITDNIKLISDKLFSSRDVSLNKLLIENISGISPLLSREIAYRSFDSIDNTISMLTEKEKDNFINEFGKLKILYLTKKITPSIIYDENNNPFDFSFIIINQYEGRYKNVTFNSISELLDTYYNDRDYSDRIKQRTSDLKKLLQIKIDRTERKLSLQKEDLIKCKDRDILLKYGNLISANINNINKGQKEVTVTDIFDDECKDITIPLDPLLSAKDNMQKYYKEYRKTDTAEKMLIGLIEDGEMELEHLYSEKDLLSRVSTFEELLAIKDELIRVGYFKRIGKSNIKYGKVSPKKYISSDGYTIYSGKNNIQNEQLTFKIANKNDIWIHVKSMPGSHTILITNGEEPPAKTYNEACIIAAVNSSAPINSKVDVDYTYIKNIKKIPNSKPGMVIYNTNYSATVTSDIEIEKSLRKE